MSWNSWVDGQAADCSKLMVKEGKKMGGGLSSKGYSRNRQQSSALFQLNSVWSVSSQ